MMYVTVSGEVPEHAVVSKKTGLVFEKGLIDKHLQLSSTCPITGSEISADDFIEVKCKSNFKDQATIFIFHNCWLKYLANKVVKPRQISATSIPGLLSMLQVVMYSYLFICLLLLVLSPLILLLHTE
jgi:pre-mRNA-processing factor 19